ncbi:hypothetical protein L6164_000799 [Bauhinia variegata]|uniref:Uncharacterized protein n=1 Tax=Bauhinia variegata TaxID=167791 RepID=A0ACB9Q7Q8_BAUVA|nr:hypothetical protein L6164_000799 [Bauhinia variegata]
MEAQWHRVLLLDKVSALAWVLLISGSRWVSSCDSRCERFIFCFSFSLLFYFQAALEKPTSQRVFSPPEIYVVLIL